MHDFEYKGAAELPYDPRSKKLRSPHLAGRGDEDMAGQRQPIATTYQHFSVNALRVH